MILVPRQEVEGAGGSSLVVSAVDDDGGPDLVPVAEYREELRPGVDPDPDRPRRNAGVVPVELAEVQWPFDLQQGLAWPVERVGRQCFVDLSAGEHKAHFPTLVKHAGLNG